MSDLIRKAATFAAEKHRDQTDKVGAPYIGHLARVASYVAEMGGDEITQAAAWLHDAIEDQQVTPLDLLNAGFPAEVIDVVVNVSKVAGESRESYRQRVMSHPRSRLLKRADIKDNTDPERVALLPLATRDRLAKKYAEDLTVLAG